MTDVVYSLGNTTIGGAYRGGGHVVGNMLYLAGTIDFYLRDSFRDPLNIAELARDLEKLNERISEEVSKLVAAGANLPVQFQRIVDELAEQFGRGEQGLRDYIRDRIRSELARQGKSLWALQQKELGELPFSTYYDIVDAWSGMFSGRIFVDGTRSQFVEA